MRRGDVTSVADVTHVVTVVHVTHATAEGSRMTGERSATAEDCGCAPTEGERRSFLAPVSRRAAIGFAAFGVVALGAIGGPLIPAAFAAAGYPSWDDVQN